MLAHDELFILRKAVISAGLLNSRTALLAGVNSAFCATLPIASVPGEQVLLDLHAMNETGALVDGTIPLLVWLRNAAQLVGSRQELYVFQDAYNRISSRPLPKPKPMSKPPSRLGRAILVLALLAIGGISLYLFVPALLSGRDDESLEPVTGTSGGSRTSDDVGNRQGMSLPGRWMRLEPNGSFEWRITAIKSTAEKFTVVIEVKNTRSSSEGTFSDFRRNPLSVVDSAGAYYSMLNTSDVPPGIRDGNGYWVVQGGRILELTEEFQPLGKSITAGHIKYSRSNNAQPLSFSIKR